jgi:DNA-binding transcriptional LysR family regulator
VASSIYTRSLIEARLAGTPLKLRIHVPGFDAVCRMAQAGMGIRIVPNRAFELLGGCSRSSPATGRSPRWPPCWSSICSGKRTERSQNENALYQKNNGPPATNLLVIFPNDQWLWGNVG